MPRAKLAAAVLIIADLLDCAIDRAMEHPLEIEAITEGLMLAAHYLELSLDQAAIEPDEEIRRPS